MTRSHFMIERPFWDAYSGVPIMYIKTDAASSGRLFGIIGHNFPISR